MRYTVRFIVSVVALTFALSFGFPRYIYAEEIKHMHGDGTSMELHHMHTMMSHGLAMVTEGSDMVMLAAMKMSPSLDPMTLEHGRQMIRSGKEVIEHFMSGSQMKELHKAGHVDDPLMQYTHELGKAMMKVVGMLEKMSVEGAMGADTMTMHHMHLIIIHALGMAAQGSNMAMLGKMGMCVPVDKFSVGEGEMMMTGARWLLKEDFEDKAMKEMHDKGVSMDKAMMAETHKLSEAAAKVIDLLEKMPSVGLK